MRDVIQLLIDDDSIKEYHYVDDFADDSFVSVFDLLDSYKTGVQSIASTIECEGEFIYTYDRFNRFIKANPVTGTDEKISKSFILNELEEYLVLKRQHLAGGAKGTEEYNKYLEDPACPLRDFGWIKCELPDFDGIHEKWAEEHANRKPKLELNNAIQEASDADDDPPQQSKVWKLLDVLLIEQYGEEFIEEAKDRRSGRIPSLRKKLLDKFNLDIHKKSLDGYLQKMARKP